MNTFLGKMPTPEEAELDSKKRELAALENELAERELELATLQAKLGVFELRYMRAVGVHYAELDDLEARIAQVFAGLHPQDAEADHAARQTRKNAEESAQAAASARESTGALDFRPSREIKTLYREIAKKAHPDLATDDEDRARRTAVMAEANRAYKDGDVTRLQAILTEWETSADSVKGNDIGADLVRTIRRIANVKARIDRITIEITGLTNSAMFLLREKVMRAEQRGLDLLAEMAEQVKQQIRSARGHLGRLEAERPHEER